MVDLGVLVRTNDGLRMKGEIAFVEFNKFGQGKKLHKKPKKGFACVVDRTLNSYKWLTSEITEVISDKEFKTKNSHYTIE